jgi:ABC-2 type transport system ATP-binding protein
MPVESELPPAIRLESLSHAFTSRGRTAAALDGVTARAERGAVTGVIGPDGAGKTTLMRLAAGLLQVQSGRIEVLGVDVARNPDGARSRIGYMPQRFGLYEDLTVRENLDLYAKVQNVPRAKREARDGELLHMTGLAPFLNRLAGRLSGGMKQKLGLACTLVRVPEVLLLDEPTVGVDPVSRRELWEIVDHLVRTEGMAVVLSTSYLDEAERCGSVLLLHEGRLVGATDPASFAARVSGRSFHVSAAGTGKRQLQERLARTPGVIDATIQGAFVRIVTDSAAQPLATALSSQATPLTVVPVPPRFEDSFVALLRSSSPATTPQGEAVARGARPAENGSRETASARKNAGSASDEPVIFADRLTRRFGSFIAVDAVSFAVRRGEIFGLLGANGAGKSTTFRMLCGLLPPSDGTLRVAGYDLRLAAASARGHIGYMAQKFSLYADLSVLENLRFFASAYRLQEPHRGVRITWALEEFGLGPHGDAVSRELPLGFKQRLALACALMHEPQILFLDEPTSGVDPLARREFWRRINALAESGVTVLVTTHFMEEAEYCDRLAVLAQGKVLAEGDPESLKARARTAEHPQPTMEDAFIALFEAVPRPRAA